ncbi:serine hydrolase domain-containing protein [Pontibacter ramchanderi]|uniref:CubicO group peptidase (Beta-lactamase class C family) n=1 Tax=Pontibacter ramchanderi TaxID=1179743 RepID=A0A2N3V2V8_9BACT|nr:serine hydrolase domain-containing protein [Pontibacter ramchanderi]PKV75961.1 CubicO group peptidase (beta-lactamase class C family) [Pontibacter ramchanderi]
MKIALFFFGFFFVVTSVTAQKFQTAKLDSLFSLLEKHDKAMGSLSVYHKGESVYQKSIGYADVDKKVKATATTPYRTGSVSKMFTATLVMQLIEEGKLSLDTKLSTLYPELPNADQITIQHLLQHQSGIFDIIKSPNFNEWMVEKRSKEELLTKIKENGSVFSPGEKRDYSNTNYIILSLILEDIEKKVFAKILEKRIIKPLQLKNTYYGESNPKKFVSSSYEKKAGVWEKPIHIDLSIPRGAAGIISTPEDLNKFMNGLFDGKLVSENSLALMKKEPGIGMYPIPVLQEEKMIGHMGGMDAFKSLVVYMPKQDMTFAYTFNGVDYPYKEIVMGIFHILLNKEYDLPNLEAGN